MRYLAPTPPASRTSTSSNTPSLPLPRPPPLVPSAPGLLRFRKRRVRTWRSRCTCGDGGRSAKTRAEPAAAREIAEEGVRGGNALELGFAFELEAEASVEDEGNVEVLCRKEDGRLGDGGKEGPMSVVRTVPGTLNADEDGLGGGGGGVCVCAGARTRTPRECRLLGLLHVMYVLRNLRVHRGHRVLQIPRVHRVYGVLCSLRVLRILHRLRAHRVPPVLHPSRAPLPAARQTPPLPLPYPSQAQGPSRVQVQAPNAAARAAAAAA